MLDGHCIARCEHYVCGELRYIQELFLSVIDGLICVSIGVGIGSRGIGVGIGSRNIGFGGGWIWSVR